MPGASKLTLIHDPASGSRGGSAMKSERVSAFSGDVLGDHDAVSLSVLLAEHKVEASDLIEASVARAERVNDQLNAIVAKDYERALAKAGSDVRGLLGGIPTFIKDTEEVAGLPLYVGSHALPGGVSAESSDIVKQLEAIGLIALGTSTTPEFGLKGTTESERFGATRNPWNTQYSTGGSSGGAAALVAAGVVPVAHANDGAGSIRIPASCCGLVGLKPSRGRLAGKPVPGYFPANIFHEGVVTRTVRDTAAFYRAIEKTCGGGGIRPIGEVQPAGTTRLRVALLTENCRGVSCDSKNIHAAQQAADLCADLGHQVQRIENPFYPGFDEDFWILWSHIAFLLRYFGKTLVSESFEHARLQGWAKFLVGHNWKNLHRMPAAFRRLKRFTAQYDHFMSSYDVLLTPTLGTPTPKLGYFGPAVPGAVHLQRMASFLPFTKYQNVSGAPAVTLPLATCADGLPIGVQFAGRFGEDPKLLELAFELEQAAPWKTLADA